MDSKRKKNPIHNLRITKAFEKIRIYLSICNALLLGLKLDKNVKIIDVACGAGNVPYILKDHGYTNIDGLDPSQGLLDAADKKGLYKYVLLNIIIYP